MTEGAPSEQPGPTIRRATVAMVVAGLLAGCTTTDVGTGITARTPDPAISELESAARRLASNAVVIPPATPLTSGSGRADRRMELTLTGIRGHWPLAVGVACHGQGTLSLRVADTPITLSCSDDQTHVLRPPRAIAIANSLTIAVESPTQAPAAWAVAVFDQTSTG